MFISSKCFSDIEIKSFIKSRNQKDKCDFTDETDFVINFEELLDFFDELLQNFTPRENGEELRDLIQSNWTFFANPKLANIVLNEVINRLNTPFNSAKTLVNFNEEILKNVGYWEVLKNQLKWENRFFVNSDYLIKDLGWDSFFNSQFDLSTNQEFYRARVHHEKQGKAYAYKEMNYPKPEKVNGGRANPSGIPYLYLSDRKETVFYEVRASYLDEISLATFKINKDYKNLKVVDFTEDITLFQPDLHISNIIKSHLLLRKISRDLSKPMRRYDSDIEYIPTQFICEFIRVITGAIGIRFDSSLDPSGKNIVLFDNKYVDCVNVSLCEVTKLKLNYRLIK